MARVRHSVSGTRNLCSSGKKRSRSADEAHNDVMLKKLRMRLRSHGRAEDDEFWQEEGGVILGRKVDVEEEGDSVLIEVVDAVEDAVEEEEYDTEDAEDVVEVQDGDCEIQEVEEKEQKVFRLLDLPAEVRLEIYRACLTRPFDVLLSKETPAAPKAPTGITIDEARNPAQTMIILADPNAAHPAQTAVPRPVRRAVRAQLRGPTASTTGGPPMFALTTTSVVGNTATDAEEPATPPRTPRPQDEDPLLVNLLRASKLVYKEARPVMYGENVFNLDLNTAQSTLRVLHQRSRGQIKRLHVTIPTHNDILERFAEVVRLSFRYCWRLKQLCINMPFIIPGADGSGTNGNTTVYANAFDILRWLPKQCEVLLEGNVCEEVRNVVDKNANLAKNLDEVAYARRQLISNDQERSPITKGRR